MAIALHPLPAGVREIPAPELFTYPFCYEPHALCIAATREVQHYLRQRTEWSDELRRGKMFGVLVVARGRERGFLAAFSGTLDGKTRHEFFVPPVFDLMAPGCYFQEEEAAISLINHKIAALLPHMAEHEQDVALLRRQMEEELADRRRLMQESKAERDALRQRLSQEALAVQEPLLVRQSQHEKAEYRRLKHAWEQRLLACEAPLREEQGKVRLMQRERHERSLALQRWLFGQFRFLNARGEERSLPELFAPAVPPAGAGECCAPRLLQAAYAEGLRPLCMAEFWVGASPADEVRHDGRFYPACNRKCRPILRHMLEGLSVESNPLLAGRAELLSSLHVIYSDEETAVVSKPAGLLSVPGKDDSPSVQEAMRLRFPQATGPLVVHRLDMDTSGLMLIALTEERYRLLQGLFIERRVHKTYHAVLEREMPVGEEGDIDLPLRPDFDDRPRQVADREHGKPALTHYRVLGNRGGHALLELCPVTGRTHQLRVHCAHRLGLDNPIVGDRLYGKPAGRLMLHAYGIEIETTKPGQRGEAYYDRSSIIPYDEEDIP